MESTDYLKKGTKILIKEPYREFYIDSTEYIFTIKEYIKAGYYRVEEMMTPISEEFFDVI